MKRIPEPELMSAEDQAKAYAQADFESAHSAYPKLFAEKFPQRSKRALVLDLGCGPCDVTVRFAHANPSYRFHAVDGSAAMLRYAKRAITKARFSRRIKLIQGFIPGAPIPRKHYDVILSSSFLHHLHDPQVLWATVRKYSKPGTIVFVPDLRRPATRAKARAFVKKYSADEPAVLQRDFYNSLLAAFTPKEIRAQLKQAGLKGLKIKNTSDGHLLVFGKLS